MLGLMEPSISSFVLSCTELFKLESVIVYERVCCALTTTELGVGSFLVKNKCTYLDFFSNFKCPSYLY